MVTIVSQNITKKVAERLHRQDSSDREEALKNLYKQIYNEKESQILIDKFEKEKKSNLQTAKKVANNLIDIELNMTVANSLQPEYLDVNELEKQLKNLMVRDDRDDRVTVNFAEEKMKEASKNIEEANKILLKKNKKNLSELQDLLRSKEEKEKKDLQEQIQMLKKTVENQQSLIDDKKKIKQNSKFKYNSQKMEKLLKEFDKSKLSKGEKDILILMKQEIANFTTENISGCVERDVVNDTYMENIEQRLKDLETVTHSGNVTPKEVNQLLKDEKKIVKRSKNKQQLEEQLNSIKKDIKELLESGNTEKIQQQAHRNAMKLHREQMMNMKTNLENQYVKIHGMLDTIGTKMDRRERTIYNLYGITWALQDLMSIFTSLFQFTSAGVKERLKGALNGILNLTKTFMTALLDSLFSVVRRVLSFFTCFEQSSLFICLFSKFAAIMMALAVTSVLLLIGYLLFNQTGIIPVLKAIWTFCYENFLHYSSIIGNFLLERVPFLRHIWQVLVSYYSYFVAIITEGVPIGLEFIRNCISWLGASLLRIAGLIGKFLLCLVPGAGMIVDCKGYGLLDALRVSGEEFADIAGNATEAFNNATANITLSYKEEGLEDEEGEDYVKPSKNVPKLKF